MHENTAHVNTDSLGSGCHAPAACSLIARVPVPTKSTGSHLGHKQHHPLSSHAVTPSFPRETRHPASCSSAPTRAPANPDGRSCTRDGARLLPRSDRPGGSPCGASPHAASHRPHCGLSPHTAGAPGRRGAAPVPAGCPSPGVPDLSMHGNAVPGPSRDGDRAAPRGSRARGSGCERNGPSEPSGAHVPRHRLRSRLRLPLLPAHLPRPGPAVTQLRCWELLLPRRAPALRHSGRSMRAARSAGAQSSIQRGKAEGEEDFSHPPPVRRGQPPLPQIRPTHF